MVSSRDLSPKLTVALLTTFALCVGFLTPAQAAVPSTGKVIRAGAMWRLPSKSTTRWKTIEIRIQRRETAEGHVYTKASVFRHRCELRGRFTICGAYRSGIIRTASFDYDTLLTKATARLVMTSGEIMKASWEALDPMPDGIWTGDTICSPGGMGKSAGLIKPAVATGTLFGVRLRRSVPEKTGLGLGVESTQCS